MTGELPAVIRLWPDEHEGPWLLHLRFKVIDGRAECVGLELRSFREPDEPASCTPGTVFLWGSSGIERLVEIDAATERISASLVRGLPIGRLLDEARRGGASLRHPRAFDQEPGWSPDPAARIDAGQKFEAAKRRGRPTQWTSERLAEVADVYLEAWIAGDPPRKAVAERFHVSMAAAAKLVGRARKTGLLGSTHRGKAGPGRKDEQ